MYMWIEVGELLSLIAIVAIISFCLGVASALYLFSKRKKKEEKK